LHFVITEILFEIFIRKTLSNQKSHTKKPLFSYLFAENKGILDAKFNATKGKIVFRPTDKKNNSKIKFKQALKIS